jgi:hydrogenase nickel incorporation protein HypA/HybF
MHELSIAYSLVETATTAAQQAHAAGVTVVYLRLGVISGVVTDALQFGWEIATAGTLLAGARLEIEEVPLVVHCPQCDRDVSLPSPQYFFCPQCHAPTPTIVQGRELELKAMEILDGEPTT